MQLDGLNSALSIVVYRDIALSIKNNTYTKLSCKFCSTLMNYSNHYLVQRSSFMLRNFLTEIGFNVAFNDES